MGLDPEIDESFCVVTDIGRPLEDLPTVALEDLQETQVVSLSLLIVILAPQSHSALPALPARAVLVSSQHAVALR